MKKGILSKLKFILKIVRKMFLFLNSKTLYTVTREYSDIMVYVFKYFSISESLSGEGLPAWCKTWLWLRQSKFSVGAKDIYWVDMCFPVCSFSKYKTDSKPKTEGHLIFDSLPFFLCYNRKIIFCVFNSGSWIGIFKLFGPWK